MQQGTEEWKEARRRYAATASRFGDVCGVGYNSAQKYMRQKLGLEPEDEENWMMERGRLMENWVVLVYQQLMREAKRAVHCREDGIAELPADRRIAGSPDRLVFEIGTGEWHVLECKTCYRSELRDHLPITHNLQMMGLCAIYGFAKAHYICWLEGEGAQLYEVSWAPGTFEQHVLPLLRRFADFRALKQVPPPFPRGHKKAFTELIESLTTVCTIEPARVARQKRRH